MSRSSSYFELRDALEQPGCAICRLEEATATRYIDNLLWELVNDSGVRQKIRRARGFCGTHAQGLVHAGAALGVSIIMKDIFESLLEIFGKQHTACEPSNRTWLDRTFRGHAPLKKADAICSTLAPQSPCLVCIHVQESKWIYLRVLVDNLAGDFELLPHFRSSEGLCLLHFCQALSLISDPAVLDSFIEAQQAIWRELADQLSEFIRKNDYRYQDEPIGAEGAAWQKAASILAGRDRGQ